MTDISTHIRPEPKRDRWGRYLINGKPYTRVTTWAESVDDRYNLELWKLRMAAKGITERPDLFAQIASIPLDDKKALDRVVSEAIDAAKGKAAANLGTALHRFTERIDAGEDVTVPAPWDKDLDAYRATLDAHDVCVAPDMIERIVVNNTLDIAGTFDRLVTVDGFDLPLVGDVKTSADLSYAFGGIAIQLACYAYADHLYHPETDTLTPMPPVDRERALVIHLPAGRGECHLYLLDIVAGWEAAQLCGKVRAWRRRKGLATALTPTPDDSQTPNPEGDPLAPRRTWLRARLERLKTEHPQTLPTIAAAWPIGVPTFKQADDHTKDQLDLISAAIREAESIHRVPFPDDYAPEPDFDPEEEQRKADRTARMSAALDALCEDDEELRQAVVAAIPESCREGDGTCAIVEAIGDAFGSGIVALFYSETGEGNLRAVDIDALKELYGGGRAALTALRTLADTLSIERPRSLAAAAEHPALVALAAASASTTQTKETS